MASGTVAIVGQLSADREAMVRVYGDRRFLGELDLFGDAPVVGTAAVVRTGEVVRLSVKQLSSVLVQDSQLRELVQRASWFAVPSSWNYPPICASSDAPATRTHIGCVAGLSTAT